jgi:hypothetical protein
MELESGKQQKNDRLALLNILTFASRVVLPDFMLKSEEKENFKEKSGLSLGLGWA